MKTRLSGLALLALVGQQLVADRDAHAQEMFGQPTIDEHAGELPPRPAPEPEPPRPEPPKARANPLALRFDGGYSYRRLFRLHVAGPDLGFGLGAQVAHHVAWFWATRYSHGETNNGLDVWSFRTGAEVEGVFDPVRFGLGLGFFTMGVGRESRNETLDAWGAEGRMFVRFDAYRSDAFALFLRGSLEAGLVTAGSALFWGPNAGLGVEFGVRGERRPEWK